MEQDWIKLRAYHNELNAELDKQLLEANGIVGVVFNKQDSSLKFGRIELYVAKADQDSAMAVLAEQNLEGE